MGSACLASIAGQETQSQPESFSDGTVRAASQRTAQTEWREIGSVLQPAR